MDYKKRDPNHTDMLQTMSLEKKANNKTPENKSSTLWRSFCIISFPIVTLSEKAILTCVKIFTNVNLRRAPHLIKPASFCLFPQGKII